MTNKRSVQNSGRLNGKGYALLTVVIVVAIIVAIVLIVPGALSRKSKVDSIEKQMDALNTTADLQSKTCSAGDPINSPDPFCEYTYADYGGQVTGALTKDGYVEDKLAQNVKNDAGDAVTIYKGGDPHLRIEVSTEKGITTITAKRAH